MLKGQAVCVFLLSTSEKNMIDFHKTRCERYAIADDLNEPVRVSLQT
jgi:hypothetical protein